MIGNKIIYYLTVITTLASFVAWVCTHLGLPLTEFVNTYIQDVALLLLTEGFTFSILMRVWGFNK